MTWCIHAFFISYKLERTISRPNLITNKHRNEEKFEVKTAFLYQCILELPFFEYGCLVRKSSQGGEEAEVGREEALISNICLISHHWYDVEKLTVPGSSTLPEIALLNFNSCFYNLSTCNSCFTTFLFTRFLFNINSTESSSFLPP